MRREYKKLDKAADLFSAAFNATKRTINQITPELDTVVGYVGLQRIPTGTQQTKAQKKAAKLKAQLAELEKELKQPVDAEFEDMPAIKKGLFDKVSNAINDILDQKD